MQNSRPDEDEVQPPDSPSDYEEEFLPDFSESDEEEKESKKSSLESLQSFLQTIKNIDSLCETPHFTNRKVPLYNQALFKGKLHAAPPFTGIKVKTRVTNPDGKEDVVEKEYKELDYDSMDAYQKALPGQGFAGIVYETKGPDGPQLVTLLIPAFNKDDSLGEHRKHLERLGIPYIESDQVRGQTTGIIHTKALRMIGISPELPEERNRGNRMGIGIWKQDKIRGRSQSQNVGSMKWDEMFLLAHGLDTYKKETGEDEEFFCRRLLKPDVLIGLASFYEKEMKKFVDEHSSLEDKENYLDLDNGDWLAFAVKCLIEKDDPRYQKMAAWNTTPSEIKANDLINTLFNAIYLRDPICFIDSTSFRKKTSFITRILALNQSKGLNLNLNVLDSDTKQTLLMHATIQNLPHVVNQLCATKDVDPNIKGEKEKTALHYAALCGNEDIVKKLLEHGASINAKDSKGRTPTETALQVILNDNKDRNPSNDIKVLTALIKAGGTLPPLALTDQDKFGRTALCIAAGCGDLEAVNVLIAYNKSKLGEEKSNSPLLTFSLLAHEKKPEVDLVNQLDFTGSTPLHAALASRNVSVILTLLENKADPNVENEAGEKPLPMAIAGKYPDMVKILLAHNAIPDETAMEVLRNVLTYGEPSEAMLQIQQLLQEHEGHAPAKKSSEV